MAEETINNFWQDVRSISKKLTPDDVEMTRKDEITVSSRMLGNYLLWRILNELKKKR